MHISCNGANAAPPCCAAIPRPYTAACLIAAKFEPHDPQTYCTIYGYIGPRKSGPRCSIISSKMKRMNFCFGLDLSWAIGGNLVVRRS